MDKQACEIKVRADFGEFADALAAVGLELLKTAGRIREFGSQLKGHPEEGEDDEIQVGDVLKCGGGEP